MIVKVIQKFRRRKEGKRKRKEGGLGGKYVCTYLCKL
jgi:hypothetical protein